MCRFALINTSNPIKPQALLHKFADMAEVSRAPDGDIQGDGWGIAWRSDQGADQAAGQARKQGWQRFTSIDPIWESRAEFARFPSTNLFLIHARSASFAKDKNQVGYNQPYTAADLAFVFNGLLRGMRFPRPLAGTIGAQKIWSLVQEVGLTEAIAQLNQYASEVQALNLGLSDGQKLYVYSQFSNNTDYYTLHFHQSSDLTLISSEPLAGLSFAPLEAKKVHVFDCLLRTN